MLEMGDHSSQACYLCHKLLGCGEVTLLLELVFLAFPSHVPSPFRNI